MIDADEVAKAIRELSTRPPSGYWSPELEALRAFLRESYAKGFCVLEMSVPRKTYEDVRTRCMGGPDVPVPKGHRLKFKTAFIEVDELDKG